MNYITLPFTSSKSMTLCDFWHSLSNGLAKAIEIYTVPGSWDSGSLYVPQTAA